MRIPKWLGVLFFASVALNVGVLVGYGYQSYLWAQERRHARTYFQGWVPDAEKRLAELMEQRLDKGYQLDSLRMATRLRLDELTYVEHPDSLEVERLLDQSAQSERELAALAYRTGRGILEIQPPEKRRQTERAYRKLMGLKDANTSSAGPTTRDSVSGTRGTTHRKGG